MIPSQEVLKNFQKLKMNDEKLRKGLKKTRNDFYKFSRRLKFQNSHARHHFSHNEYKYKPADKLVKGKLRNRDYRFKLPTADEIKEKLNKINEARIIKIPTLTKHQSTRSDVDFEKMFEESLNFQISSKMMKELAGLKLPK